MKGFTAKETKVKGDGRVEGWPSVRKKGRRLVERERRQMRELNRGSEKEMTFFCLHSLK